MNKHTMEQERLRGNTRRMYVGGLDATVSSDELHRLFSAYGRIVDRIVIGNDKYTFIQFEHPADCVSAVESRAPFVVGARGAKLNVRYAEEKSQVPKKPTDGYADVTAGLPPPGAGMYGGAPPPRPRSPPRGDKYNDRDNASHYRREGPYRRSRSPSGGRTGPYRERPGPKEWRGDERGGPRRDRSLSPRSRQRSRSRSPRRPLEDGLARPNTYGGGDGGAGRRDPYGGAARGAPHGGHNPADLSGRDRDGRKRDGEDPRSKLVGDPRTYYEKTFNSNPGFDSRRDGKHTPGLPPPSTAPPAPPVRRGPGPPAQMLLLGEENRNYANYILQNLTAGHIGCEVVDLSGRNVGESIGELEKKGCEAVLVIGRKNEANRTISFKPCPSPSIMSEISLAEVLERLNKWKEAPPSNPAALAPPSTYFPPSLPNNFPAPTNPAPGIPGYPPPAAAAPYNPAAPQYSSTPTIPSYPTGVPGVPPPYSAPPSGHYNQPPTGAYNPPAIPYGSAPPPQYNTGTAGHSYNPLMPSHSYPPAAAHPTNQYNPAPSNPHPQYPHSGGATNSAYSHPAPHMAPQQHAPVAGTSMYPTYPTPNNVYQSYPPPSSTGEMPPNSAASVHQILSQSSQLVQLSNLLKVITEKKEGGGDPYRR